MAKLISINVNLDKLTESKIFISKNGQKFANLLVEVKDKKDDYNNDVAVSENQTKEDRLNQVKKVYVGSGRVLIP